MKAWWFSISIVLLTFSPSVFGASYTQSDLIVGEDFYNAFNFEAIPDPTAGRVYACSVGLLSLWLSSLLRNYVDEATAKRLNLTFASSDTFILRADYTTTLNPNGPGRNSVRIRTNNVYTTHVVVSVLFFFPPTIYFIPK